MHNIVQNLNRIRREIQYAEQKHGREPGSVRLIAVSKTHPVRELRCVIEENHTDLGESYVQEAIRKISEIGKDKACWHFIGPIQSNKTRLIAENFSWVHSVDRIKIAQRLSNQRPPDMPALNICLQLNLLEEAGKSGISVDEVAPMIKQIHELPNITLRGFMTIPAKTQVVSQQREQFKQVKILFNELNSKDLSMDTLSMGTSHDVDAAIAEGATMVRIGTAIFGPRTNIKPD